MVWHYWHSRVSTVVADGRMVPIISLDQHDDNKAVGMTVADGLATIRHQDICNKYNDVSRSACVMKDSTYLVSLRYRRVSPRNRCRFHIDTVAFQGDTVAASSDHPCHITHHHLLWSHLLQRHLVVDIRNTHYVLSYPLMSFPKLAHRYLSALHHKIIRSTSIFPEYVQLQLYSTQRLRSQWWRSSEKLDISGTCTPDVSPKRPFFHKICW